ncbi:MAG: hypothetical protein HUK22_01780, partial [Thermoguttaceae bacterium]|nr:hypothetical protein [Thermoguttaceae bacterium]
MSGKHEEINVEAEYDDGPLGVGDILVEILKRDGILLDLANPFRLPGVVMKGLEPENPGRFASLLGSILADIPQNPISIDLLHPREKPKPPNYALVSLTYVVLVAFVFGGFWYWNKTDLKRIEGELAALEKDRDATAAELNTKMPLYSVLSQANAWQYANGVNALDELRDITARIPKAPDLVVTRLAFMGELKGRPTFVISAKITSIEVYQQFRAALVGDRSHAVVSSGPRPNVGGGGYKYLFEANVVCAYRNRQTFLAKLPDYLRKISDNPPERFVEMEKERVEAEKQRQEEARKKAEELREATRTQFQELCKAQDEAWQKALDEAQNTEFKLPSAEILQQRRAILEKRYKDASLGLQNKILTQEEANTIGRACETGVSDVVRMWNELAQKLNAARQQAQQQVQQQQAP